MCGDCGLGLVSVVDRQVVLWKLKFLKDRVLNLSRWGLLDLLCCSRFLFGYRLCGERVIGVVVDPGRLVELDIQNLGIDAGVDVLYPQVVPCPS